MSIVASNQIASSMAARKIARGIVEKSAVNPIAGNLVYDLPLNGGLGAPIGDDGIVYRAAAGTYLNTDHELITVGNNIARFENNGLLLESGDTNHALRSNEFDHSAWTSAGQNITVSGGYPDPFGGNTAYKITSTSTDDSASYIGQILATAVKSGAVWFKLGEQNNGFSFGTSAGFNDYAKDSVTGWMKSEFEGQSADATYVIALNDAGIFGNNSEGDCVYICNAQGSTLDIVGSYIETEGTTATRGGADVLSIASGNIPSRLSDHSLSMHVRPFGVPSGSFGYFAVFVNDANPQRHIAYLADGKIRANWGTNSITSSTAMTTGKTHQVVVAADGANFEMFIDGVSQGTAAITGTDTASACTINQSGLSFFHVSKVKAYDKRLSASELVYA